MDFRSFKFSQMASDIATPAKNAKIFTPRKLPAIWYMVVWGYLLRLELANPLYLSNCFH